MSSVICSVPGRLIRIPSHNFKDHLSYFFFSKVTLKANGGVPFTGFMLEARKPDNSTPQGIFSLTETRFSRLQKCGDIDVSVIFLTFPLACQTKTTTGCDDVTKNS